MLPYFKCQACKVILPTSEAINRPWNGWKPDGTIVPVENFCCPDCGSNDLTYREKGE